MITKQQKEYLLPKAYNAAIRAGAAILEIYTSGDRIDVEIKEDMTPITLADRRAHSVIKEYLGQTRIPLLSEEGREMLYAERKDWDLFWMVDPLDGTVEFLKGNGEFTVNIALMADNRPAFGVIYVPYKGIIYFSDGDLGAFRSSVKADGNAEYGYESIIKKVDILPVTSGRNIPLKIAVSRSHRNEATDSHLQEVFKIIRGPRYSNREAHTSSAFWPKGASTTIPALRTLMSGILPPVKRFWIWPADASIPLKAAEGFSTIRSR